MSWVFNQTEFGQYSWTVDPVGSLNDYYDRRAKELREKYDYLVLNYSGGSDSHNILMAFYRNNLHLDEVVTNWIFDASKKFTIEDNRITDAWNQNAEYELNTRDKLKWIANHMPNTKVSLYDCGKQIFDYFAKAKDESWVFDAIEATNPGAMQRYNVLGIKEIRERFDHFTSIGVIVGVDKPRCILDDDDNLFLIFFDKIANVVPVSKHLVDYTNTTTEYFYWSPESCDMLAKQSHSILTFLRQNPAYRTLWREQAWNNRVVQEYILRSSVIYDTWEESFQVVKPIQDWFVEYDYWFTDQFKTLEPVLNWKRGLDYLKSNIDPSLLHVRPPHQSDVIHQQVIQGLELYNSPRYFIGKI